MTALIVACCLTAASLIALACQTDTRRAETGAPAVDPPGYDDTDPTTWASPPPGA